MRGASRQLFLLVEIARLAVHLRQGCLGVFPGRMRLTDFGSALQQLSIGLALGAPAFQACLDFQAAPFRGLHLFAQAVDHALLLLQRSIDQADIAQHHFLPGAAAY